MLMGLLLFKFCLAPSKTILATKATGRTSMQSEVRTNSAWIRVSLSPTTTQFTFKASE